jgi:mono/diheme cytochrome c family protein
MRFVPAVPWALASALPLWLVVPAAAQHRTLAANEYRLSCQGCHGPRGKGDGPAARSLARKPADLTLLEQSNDYRFPYLKVFQAIDGRAVIPAHGAREMPVWGRRYVEDIGETYGPYGGEAAVRARIEGLVQYVRSLQER